LPLWNTRSRPSDRTSVGNGSPDTVSIWVNGRRSLKNAGLPPPTIT
jgi:hypothetical protein